MKSRTHIRGLALLVLTFGSTAPLAARASVLGAYYTVEQARLNHMGYTQNILPVKMPSGETCRISYFHHRSSKGTRRHVLLHGFLDRALTWRRLISEMPENTPLRKNLILVDLPHHGDSTCAEVNSFAKAEAFVHLGIEAIRKKERFRVNGIWTGSLGGLFGLALLNSYPDAQLSMVVPPLLAKPFADIKIREIADLNTPKNLESFLLKVPPPHKKIPLMNTVVSGLLTRAQFAKTVVSGVSADHLWSGYVKTPHRVRIMVSEDDSLLPIREMDTRFTKNKKSDYRVVSGCGHSIIRFCSAMALPFLMGDIDDSEPATAALSKPANKVSDAKSSSI